MAHVKETELRDPFNSGLKTGKIRSFIFGFSFLSCLFIISKYNYLVFHTFSELISIVVAWCLFLIVWNTRETARNDAFLFLGTAFFFIGGIDLFHTIAYKGMGVFNSDSSANPATQFWIVARYMQSFSLCLFPFLLLKL